MKYAISVLFMCLIAIPAMAEGPDDIYVDLMPVFGRMDSDRGADNDAYGARVVYGRGWRGPWYAEVQGFGLRQDGNHSITGNHLYTSGVGMDAVYAFRDRTGYTPFLLAGAGATVNNGYPGGSDVNAFLNLGAGIASAALNDNGLKIRAEVRYMRDYFEDDMNDWQLGLGLSFPLQQPAPPPAPKPAPAPAPEPPRDSDDDGVIDDRDRCPDTLPGAEVDSEGCVLAEETITLENVHFELDSATLTPAARNSLQKVVRALRSQPGSAVEIAGHTDNQGNDAYNLKLSQQRANSVRTFLIRNGVDADRLTAKGYGEQQPVESNATESGRAMNRRVEMRFR
ncbi:OmpA family protein [Microbulbifer halophilus]|uniref:OmpA family protein n=1 Tax=Microbulbifer halophilus TaxID=453963 RepID=A0ABW5EA69_9GAMM|nr:OmpA family protein [Microbulbifer halophilus]MCW8128069.1 OmpA family protein [Microbulbifer halophilus]